MKKDVGAILLVSGTTIGAGMLALPVVTNPMGIFLALFFYGFLFFVMLLSAKFFLKSVLHFEETHNFVALAKKTLGIKAAGLCWLVYLLLMYALVAAYISASSHMISAFTAKALPNISESVFFLLLPIIFAFFVHYGFRGIDLLNRLFMLGLIISFFGLCAYLFQAAQIHFDPLMNIKAARVALPILITAFGYHIIIPSIASYLDRNEKRIHRAILIGSLIPLLVYLIWHVLIYFNLSEHDLTDSLRLDIPLTDVLSKIHPSIAWLSSLFAFFAIITSFLGVSLALFDFLKDSLPDRKVFKQKKILFVLTFLPPLVYIFYFKKAFYLALDHAGILVCILLIIFPCLMYIKISKKAEPIPLILTLIAVLVIILDIFTKTSLLN